MSIFLDYLIKGSSQDVLDLRTPGHDFELVGESVTVTGSAAVNFVYSAMGVSLDVRGLGGGEDIIIFTHAWSDYVKSLSEVSGAIVFTYYDSVTSLTERVIVGNGVGAQTRDKLVFSDGAVLTQNANTALKSDLHATLSSVTGYTSAVTNETVVAPVNSGSTFVATASGSGAGNAGAIFAMGETGQTTQVTGTAGVDKVYVKAGAIVDARGLLAGEDIIYFTGNWADYSKSSTAVAGAIQFTRSVNGLTETVTVGNGVSSAARDKLVFADGAVLTQNVNSALRTDINVALNAVTGYDATTTTPFLSDVSSITFSGGQSAGLTNGTANVGDQVVFDVAMKSAVTVSTTNGTPRLAINVGGVAKYADYDAASSTASTLRFKYVVVAGDTDANGISLPDNAIDLHGATITVNRSGTAAGLKYGAISDNSAFKVDTTAPTVSGLVFAGQTGAANNTLNAGDTATIEVTFSENVYVSNTPTLRIKVGNQDRDAVYVSGSGTTKLQFRYTVVTGDTDADGISVDGSSLALNGATIRDLAGTDAILSHPAMADDPLRRVDTTKPTVTAVSISGATGIQNDFLNADDVVTLEISFSEAVDVDVSNGAPKLKIEVGGVTRDAIYVSGSGTDRLHFSYAVLAGDSDADGISVMADSLGFIASAIQDPAGNIAIPIHAAVDANPHFKVDTTAPVILDTVIDHASTAVDGWLGVGSVVSIAVVFDKPVDVTGGQPRIVLMIGSHQREAVYVGGSGTGTLYLTYTIVDGDDDVDGISIVADSFAAGGASITDVAGNSATLAHASVSDNPDFRVDTTDPTIASIAVSSIDNDVPGWLREGQSITFAVTFSEIVDGSAGEPYLSIMVGGEARQAAYASGLGSDVLYFTYVAAVGDVSLDGITVVANGFTLDGATLTDAVGNSAVLTHDAFGVLDLFVDTQAPALQGVTLSTNDDDDGWLREGDTVILTATFNELVFLSASAGEPTLTISVGGVLREAVYVGGSGTNVLSFSYTIQAGDDAPEGIEIPSGCLTGAQGAISDHAGNPAGLDSDGVPSDDDYRVDTEVPTVVEVILSESTALDGWLHEGDTVSFQVKLSELVTVDETGGSPTLHIRIGDQDVEATYAGGSGTDTLTFVYTVEAGEFDEDGISIQSNGFSSNGSVITDIAGNDAVLDHAEVSDDADNRVDAVTPMVSSISLASVSGDQDGHLNAGDILTFHVSFSETVFVDVSGGTPRIAIEIGSVIRYATYVSGDGTDSLAFSYTVIEGDVGPDGVWVSADSLELDGGLIRDLGGNDADLSHQALEGDPSILIDTTSPSIVFAGVTGSSRSDGLPLTVDDTIAFTVQFSELVEIGGGVPVLKILVGGEIRDAIYVDGAGSDTLHFEYVVRQGDNDLDGISIVENGLEPSGATIVDSAGNPAVFDHAATVDDPSYTVDTAAPVIEAITVAEANASGASILQQGHTVYLAVTFGEIVFVSQNGAIPTLSILVGDVVRTAEYVSGSGTAELRFAYIVQAEDQDADGISVPANALDDSGNVIADVPIDAVAPSVLTAVIDGDRSGATNGIFAVGKTIWVAVTFDGSVIVDTANGTPSILMQFGSEVREAFYIEGSGSTILYFAYTVAKGDLDADGVALPASSISLNSGTITDAAGNAATTEYAPVTDDPSVLVDAVIPEILAASAEPVAGLHNDFITEGGVASFKLTFSKTVVVDTSGGLPVVMVNVGGVLREAIYVSGSGSQDLIFSYVVQVGDEDSDGIELVADSLQLQGGAIRDEAGNDAHLTHLSATPETDYAVDTAAPVALTSSMTALPANFSGWFVAGETVEISIEYSEVVTVDTTGGTPVVAILVGGEIRYATYVEGSGSASLRFRYEIAAGDADQDGISVPAGAIDLRGGTISDAAGNAADPTVAEIADDAGQKVDTSTPQVLSIVSIDATPSESGWLRENDVVTFGATFDEIVFVDISASTPVLTIMVGGVEREAVYVSGSGTTMLEFAYTIVSGDVASAGIVIPEDALALRGAAISDEAGNAASTANAESVDAGVLVDAVVPAVLGVSFVSPVTQGAIVKRGDTISVEVHFSETVDVDVNGGVPTIIIMLDGEQREAVYISGSGTDRLTFAYVVVAGDRDTDGASIAQDNLFLNGGSISDAAGNDADLAHAAVADDSDIIVATDAPTIVSVAITETSAEQGAILVAGDTVRFTVTFSKTVQLDTSIGAPSMRIDVGGVERFATYDSMSGSTMLVLVYTIQADDEDVDGISVPENALVLNGATIADSNGYDAETASAAVADAAMYSVDAVAPAAAVLALVAGIDNGASAAEAETTGVVEITAEAGGTVTVTFVNGAQSVVKTLAASGDPQSVTLTAGEQATLGDGTIVVHAVVTDSAGNIGSESQSQFLLDTVGPAIQSGGVAVSGSEGAEDGWAQVGDRIFIRVAFDEIVTVDGLPELFIIVGSDVRRAVYVSGSGTAELIFAYTVEEGDTDEDGISIPDDALVLTDASVMDIAGNPASPTMSAVVDNESYKIDTMNPQLIATSLDSGESIQTMDAITFTFDEPVQRGAGVIRLTGSDGDVREIQITDTAQVSIDINTLTLKLTEPLHPYIDYEITVEDGIVTDFAGNPVAGLTGSSIPVHIWSPIVQLSGIAAGNGGFAISGAPGNLGSSVSAVGDVNGDGLDDLIVGAYGYTGATGRAYVVFGRTDSVAINTSAIAGGSGGFVINGTSLGDYAGASVSAAGDFNGDGLADLIVAAPGRGGVSGSFGRTYLVYGHTSGDIQLSAVAAGSGGFAIDGQLGGDTSGVSVSYAGDVNGDGFADLVIGAPGYSGTLANQGRAYVLFGGTSGLYSETMVDAVGTGSADTMSDDGVMKTLMGGAGNDTIALAAAGSVAHGGIGNDTFVISAAMVSALQSAYGAGGNLGQMATLSGGSGIDTLRLDGAGMILDLTKVASQAASNIDGGSRIDSVEKIDLTGSGDNKLKLDVADVLDMGGVNIFATTGKHQLMVDGNAGDTVEFASAGWTKGASLTYGAYTYDAWSHSPQAVTVYVTQSVTVL